MIFLNFQILCFQYNFNELSNIVWHTCQLFKISMGDFARSDISQNLKFAKFLSWCLIWHFGILLKKALEFKHSLKHEQDILFANWLVKLLLMKKNGVIFYECHCEKRNTLVDLNTICWHCYSYYVNSDCLCCKIDSSTLLRNQQWVGMTNHCASWIPSDRIVYDEF